MKKPQNNLIALVLLIFLAATPTQAGATNETDISAIPEILDERLPHFLTWNYERYERYQASNPEMPFDVVVALVNANVDLGHYNEIQVAEDPDAINVFINKNFALPANYRPGDLVTSTEGKQLRAEAAEHYELMRADANAAGHNIYISSGFRDYGNQAASYNRYLDRGTEYADRRSARPGHSEHQTGLAIDFTYRRDLVGETFDGSFAYTGIFAWLTTSAHRYGFILRYPQGLGNIHGYIYESWHWRYVGEETATRMFEEGIVTFEEYYGRYMQPQVQENIALLEIRQGPPVPEEYEYRNLLNAIEMSPYPLYWEWRLA